MFHVKQASNSCLDDDACQNLQKNTVSVLIQMTTDRATMHQRQAKRTIAAKLGGAEAIYATQQQSTMKPPVKTIADQGQSLPREAS